MSSLAAFVLALAMGVHLTLLAVLLALRRLHPRPDLTFAWAAWALTLVVVAVFCLGLLRGDAPPFGSTPVAPTP